MYQWMFSVRMVWLGVILSLVEINICLWDISITMTSTDCLVMVQLLCNGIWFAIYLYCCVWAYFLCVYVKCAVQSEADQTTLVCIQYSAWNNWWHYHQRPFSFYLQPGLSCSKAYGNTWIFIKHNWHNIVRFNNNSHSMQQTWYKQWSTRNIKYYPVKAK